MLHIDPEISNLIPICNNNDLTIETNIHKIFIFLSFYILYFIRLIHDFFKGYKWSEMLDKN